MKPYEYGRNAMKRIPLYRAPVAGLMSLALLAPAAPAASPDAAPHAQKKDDKLKLEDRSPSGRDAPGA
jgi:hypothetical protein